LRAGVSGFLRLGTRLEEEGRVRFHLVEVGENVGLPAVEDGESCLRFGMLHRQPISIEIEPVVVRAPARPAFLVFAVQALADELAAAMHVRPGGEALQAIGVERRVEQHDRVREQRVDRGPLCGGKMVGDQQRRVRTAGLVAVHAVAEEDDDGERVRIMGSRGR
jgi:hypothetical protein